MHTIITGQSPCPAGQSAVTYGTGAPGCAIDDGGRISSPSGSYYLTVQADQNLVLYSKHDLPPLEYVRGPPSGGQEGEQVDSRVARNQWVVYGLLQGILHNLFHLSPWSCTKILQLILSDDILTYY